MTAAVAKQGDEQVGRTVDHFGLVGEIGRAVDKAQQLDHFADFVQIPQLLLQGLQDIEHDLFGRIITLLNVQVFTELALDERHAAILEDAGPVAGDKQEVAGAHQGQVVGHRGGDGRQGQPEFFEFLFSFH